MHASSDGQYLGVMALDRFGTHLGRTLLWVMGLRYMWENGSGVCGSLVVDLLKGLD